MGNCELRIVIGLLGLFSLFGLCSLEGVAGDSSSTLSRTRIPFRGTTVIEEWRRQPAVPLPTLDHHLGKVTASVGVFSVLALSLGSSQDDLKRAALITSGVALTFEVVQIAFFDETPLHALNDMVLFSFHWGAYGFLRREYALGFYVTVDLTGLYLVLLTQ